MIIEVGREDGETYPTYLFVHPHGFGNDIDQSKTAGFLVVPVGLDDGEKTTTPMAAYLT